VVLSEVVPAEVVPAEVVPAEVVPAEVVPEAFVVVGQHIRNGRPLVVLLRRKDGTDLVPRSTGVSRKVVVHQLLPMLVLLAVLLVATKVQEQRRRTTRIKEEVEVGVEEVGAVVEDHEEEAKSKEEFQRDPQSLLWRSQHPLDQLCTNQRAMLWKQSWNLILLI